MELDGESLEGHWAEDSELGVEFFIINDAVFSKLCILGDDVEPCYEGSSVTSPQVSSNFSKEEFGNTLFTMMQELKNTLDSKGGLNMSDTKNQEDFELDNEVTPEQDVEDTAAEDGADFEEHQDNNNDDDAEDFAKDDEKKDEEKKDDSDDKDDDDSDDEKKDDEKKPNNQHSAEEFEKLENEVESLRAEIKELRDFKLQIENQRKQSLIDKYFMLSDEDKKDIIDHMADYSFDEIKAKLAILYVEQNVDFTKVDGQSDDKPSPEMTFSLEDETTTEQLSDLQRALREANK